MLCLGAHRSSSEILKRQKRNAIFSIDEGYDGEFPYQLGLIKVEEKASFFEIHGQGVDEEPKGILQINKNTGILSVHGPVDYEKYRVLKLNYQSFDSDNQKIRAAMEVDISILDANDNPPKFEQEIYEVTIFELISQGAAIITITASDDDTDESNRLFDLKIISVTPRPSEMEFYLTQEIHTGTISFKGCLDRQKAEKYTIIVEARDRGEKKQLSSSCTVIVHIEDGNNHLPQIIGQTGKGRVKEREESVLVSRLQVTDEDSKGTPAWRAKYQIQGDPNNNFKITTDPETNEGQLYVQKHLDYKDGPLRNLTISVENEISYQTCKVVSHSTTGLWQVVIVSGETVTKKTHLSTRQVSIIVEDVNEAPYFDTPSKQITVVENVKVGWHLWTFTAKDPDVTSGNIIVYRKSYDPAGWITVDIKTGKITTTKIIDRESSYVKNNIYTVTIWAVDNGQPPMTGTATLSIHITDENDNPPFPPVITTDICQSDGLSRANITAMDPDEDPHGGPFTFKLQGNVKGKWKLDPTQGHSIYLVKEKTVDSGHYELLLEVFDLQGIRTEHNLSVTVCKCIDPARPNCHIHKGVIGGGAIGIIAFVILLLAGVLLLAILVSCKRDGRPVQLPDRSEGSEQHLMVCNIERPGTDCKVALEQLNKEYSQSEIRAQIVSQVPQIKLSTSEAVVDAQTEHATRQSEKLKRRMDYLDLSVGASSTMRMTHQHRHSIHGTWAGQKTCSGELNDVRCEMVIERLNEMLDAQQAPGEELGDYTPHVYAEEGDPETNFELDAISISDTPFDPNLDQDLDYRFNTLASVCMPSESLLTVQQDLRQRL
ncbi:cadherin-2-like [Epinephelus fuscoguttatus]|uniref:cadherin-2-like n=1 Tax=Epinephelus fuscoguttatus TaxID=293821 RepID=UPI0020D0A232|nr:cadherin-2-like [Epinephelus fuscoguttatus]